MKHRVVWTEAAVRDLEDIVDYIAAEDGLINAEKVYERIDAASVKLTQSARRARVVPELRRVGVDAYRELIVTKVYRIVFRIRGREVAILAVLDGRRDLEELLLRRALAADD